MAPVVQPDEAAPVWFASVAVLDEGSYETVRRDVSRNEHDVTTATSINDIAHDLTVWLATHDSPGRPTRQITEFCSTDQLCLRQDRLQVRSSARFDDR